jgi:hypothetical protein
VGDKPAIAAQFIIGRSCLSSMMTNILPALISVFIGHLTNYFQDFEVAVGTNLTILLVLVTL